MGCQENRLKTTLFKTNCVFMGNILFYIVLYFTDIIINMTVNNVASFAFFISYIVLFILFFAIFSYVVISNHPAHNFPLYLPVIPVNAFVLHENIDMRFKMISIIQGH